MMVKALFGGRLLSGPGVRELLAWSVGALDSLGWTD